MARCSARLLVLGRALHAPLEGPVAIGQEAARRTLRRLGARQAKTQQAPVVFSPEIARSIVGNIFDAANGDAIYRHAKLLRRNAGRARCW